MFDLTGKTALVTGATGGIGGSIARALHAQGAHVVLSGTREAALEALAAELGGRTSAVTANLSDSASADSLFHAEARATYDAVLCLYHDQALIPVKMLDFWGGVNVTLGLPIVRTSPDHGTGFDIAGRGLARADSLIAAIRLAAQIAARRAA